MIYMQKSLNIAMATDDEQVPNVALSFKEKNVTN